MANALHNFNRRGNARQTPQTQKARADQVKNNAGGYVFRITPAERFRRFLVLGTDGGTYYVGERQMTFAAIQSALEFIEADGMSALADVHLVSVNGLAYRQSPTLWALSALLRHPDVAVRRRAADVFTDIVRTASHLYEVAEFVTRFDFEPFTKAPFTRGWNSVTRRAFASWFDMPASKLAYQAIKYRQRDGWKMADILRLAHPRPKTIAHDAIFKWVLGKADDNTWRNMPDIITAFDTLRAGDVEAEDIKVAIDRFGLPWEAIPSEFLADSATWRALLPRLPMTAMFRNVGRMTANGTIGASARDEMARIFAERATDAQAIRRARLHPFQALVAYYTYKSGGGFRGRLSWNPNPTVVGALMEAFSLTMDVHEGPLLHSKGLVIGVDVSGSMGLSTIFNTNVSAATGAAALASYFASRSRYADVLFFARNVIQTHDASFVGLLRAYERHHAGWSTDASLPFKWAIQNGVDDVDAFIIITDNETWYGDAHPYEALNVYRRKFNRPDTKLIVVGMVATEFSIAPDDDPHCLNVAGFDASAWSLIADFIAG